MLNPTILFLYKKKDQMFKIIKTNKIYDGPLSVLVLHGQLDLKLMK